MLRKTVVRCAGLLLVVPKLHEVPQLRSNFTTLAAAHLPPCHP
jgi:hypothetical protein